MVDDPIRTIADEIVMVRKLIVFALLNSGVSQEKVAQALGVSQATISRLSGSGKGNGRSRKGRKKSRR